MTPKAKCILWTLVIFSICWGAAGVAIWNARTAPAPPDGDGPVASNSKAQDVVYDVEDLWGEYSADKKAFFEKYKDQVIVVRGTVDTISGIENWGKVYVYLRHLRGDAATLRVQTKVRTVFYATPGYDQGFDMVRGEKSMVPFGEKRRLVISGTIKEFDRSTPDQSYSCDFEIHRPVFIKNF